MLRYHDKTEARTLLQVDGKSVTGDSEGLKGTTSNGEFGGVLDAILETPPRRTSNGKRPMRWALERCRYSITRWRSKTPTLKLRGAGNDQRTVSFHGQVYIDSATRSVRRVTLIADNCAKDFPIHATTIAVDYDYVVINAHDYLMPISAEVGVKKGRRAGKPPRIAFKDYRRYGSNVKILDFKPIDKP